MFKAGAGRIDHYSHCAWQVLGEGQFLPLDESNPSVGSHNQLEKVIEYKVELVCDADHIEAAIAALLKAHPYETPAYSVLKCEEFKIG